MRGHQEHSISASPHESPASMTMPLVILAACAILLGAIGTPAWPWFDSFINGELASWNLAGFFENGILLVMLSSSIIVFFGLGLGWWFYGREPIASAEEPDALERLQPQIFNLLRNKFYVDEFYRATFIRCQCVVVACQRLVRSMDLEWCGVGCVLFCAWTFVACAVWG